MRNLIAMAGVAVMAMPALAGGIVIWDETVDGNLSGDPFAPTMLDAVVGNNIVRGSTLGSATPPSDGYDVFGFTIESGWTLDAIILSAYSPNASTATSGFNFSSGASVSNGGALIFGPGVGAAAVGTDFFVTQGVGGPLGPGDYFMEVREFGGPLAQWELTFVVTPSPSSVALLGFGGLVAGRRRR